MARSVSFFVRKKRQRLRAAENHPVVCKNSSKCLLKNNNSNNSNKQSKCIDLGLFDHVHGVFNGLTDAAVISRAARRDPETRSRNVSDAWRAMSKTVLSRVEVGDVRGLCGVTRMSGGHAALCQSGCRNSFHAAG